MPDSSIARRLIAGLIFGFLVILGLVLFSDVRKVSRIIFEFQWDLYPIVLVLTLVNYTLRGLKFHYYLRQIGADTIPIYESFRIFVAGFPLAVTPGKVGEALKGVWIHKKTGVLTAKGISVVLAERITDGLAVMLLSTLGVIAYPLYWPAFVGILIFLLSIILISQIQPLAFSLLNLTSRLPLIKRFACGLRDFYTGSLILFKPIPLMAGVGLGIISWLFEGIGFFIILLGLGLPPSLDTLSIAIFILAFSTVIGAVSALPGGLGAAEASIGGMLILFLELGNEISTAATLLIRFATLWFGIGLGLVVWSFSQDLFRNDDAVLGTQEMENEIK